MNTLKEIENKLQEFCANSAVINEYQFDQFTGDLTSDNHKYPLFWATPIRMSVVNGQISFILQISVMDLQYEKSDLMKILSDLAIIVAEVQTYLDDNSENFNYFITISGDFEPFSQGIDNACGWQGQITFRTKFEVSHDDIRLK